MPHRGRAVQKTLAHIRRPCMPPKSHARNFVESGREGVRRGASLARAPSTSLMTLSLKGTRHNCARSAWSSLLLRSAAPQRQHLTSTRAVVALLGNCQQSRRAPLGGHSHEAYVELGQSGRQEQPPALGEDDLASRPPSRAPSQVCAL